MSDAPDSSTISTERVKLTNCSPRTTPSGGWGAVLFSLPFIGVGTGITLVGLRVIEVDESSVHAPWWVITFFGLVFGLAGLAVLVSGLRGLIRRRRRDAALAARPEE
ncbi:MAG: hypothetical protein R3336_08055, partial [Phycisphaeraceae bacterium]|nr:hypothetical protein [Phycisphaeraceae bacterium]